MTFDERPTAEAPAWLDDVDADSDRAANDLTIVSRVPPHDLDAEAAVLSAVLVDPAALPKVPGLRPEHFYSEAHRRIFEAAVELSSAGKPVDVVQVATWLRDHERLAQVGGVAYLTEVLDAAPAVANVAAYGDTVTKAWRARQAILTGQKVAAVGYAGGDPDQLVTSALADLAALQPAPPIGSEVLTGREMAEALPPLEYLVEDIGLVAGGGAPHMVAGYGFSAKTVAVQSMAVSLAAGVRLWGTYPARARRVLHVDLEQGRRLTQRRYQRLARAMGIDLSELGDALSVAIMPPLALRPTDAAAWRSLMTGRDLLIVDSLRAATGGQDENSSDIRSGLDMLGGLSEATGCRALVIHHARKVGQDDPGGRFAIRGSSALFDACDSAYLFSAAKDEPISVEHLKARSHGEPVPDWALVVSDVEVDGDPRAGLRVQVHGAELVAERREARQDAAVKAQGAKDAAKVREALTKHPGVGTTELRGITRLPGDRLAAAIVALGCVEVVAEQVGRATTQRHYLRGGQ